MIGLDTNVLVRYIVVDDAAVLNTLRRGAQVVVDRALLADPRFRTLERIR